MKAPRIGRTNRGASVAYHATWETAAGPIVLLLSAPNAIEKELREKFANIIGTSVARFLPTVSGACSGCEQEDCGDCPGKCEGCSGCSGKCGESDETVTLSGGIQVDAVSLLLAYRARECARLLTIATRKGMDAEAEEARAISAILASQVTDKRAAVASIAIAQVAESASATEKVKELAESGSEQALRVLSAVTLYGAITAKEAA